MFEIPLDNREAPVIAGKGVIADEGNLHYPLIQSKQSRKSCPETIRANSRHVHVEVGYKRFYVRITKVEG